MDILDLLDRGSENADKLAEYAGLKEAVDAFLEVYEGLGGYSVVAASQIAERVLGGAMLMRPDIQVGAAQQTVILDVNFASGTSLAKAASNLRRSASPDEVIGVALYSLVEAPHHCNVSGLTKLIIAGEPTSEGSLDWESADCGEYGVRLAG